jgi:general secretion pathway protein A
LAQRIVARYHLGPLSKGEVSRYVNHRLYVAGGQAELFLPSSLSRLYSLSGGIPRIINAICDRSLLGACVQGKLRVDRATLVKAAREVLGEPLSRSGSYKKVAALVLAAVLLVSAGVFATMIYQRAKSTVAANGQAAVTEAEKAAPSGPETEAEVQETSSQAAGVAKDTEMSPEQPTVSTEKVRENSPKETGN